MGCCLSRKEDSPTNADLSDVNEFLIDTSLKNETFESLFSKKGWWRLGKPLTILLCCFLVLHLTIRAVSNSLLFQGTTGFLFGPNKRTADDCDCKATYQSSGLTNVRETHFPSGSFTKLHGVFVPAQKAVATESVPTIIYFHGNLATVETSSYTVWNIQNYLKGKVNVFVWDYRRYGLSGGIFPTERTMLQDSKAAYDYVVKQTEVDREKVFAFGESVGGAVAIQFVEKYWNLLAGAIFQNTFTRVRDVVSGPEVVPILRYVIPVLDFAGSIVKWKSIDRIGNIECPILMFSSEKDKVISKHLMEELRDAAKKEKVKFVSIPERGHNNAPWCSVEGGCRGTEHTCSQKKECYWENFRNFVGSKVLPSVE
eukprot:116437_1